MFMASPTGTLSPGLTFSLLRRNVRALRLTTFRISPELAQCLTQSRPPQNNCNTSAVSTTPSSNYVSRSGHQYEWKKERLGRSLVVFSFNGRKVKTIFCNHYLTLAGKVNAQACGSSSVAPSRTHISVSALHVFY